MISSRARRLRSSNIVADLIPHAPHRHDRTIVAKLAPQLADVHIDRARITRERVSPDALEQLITRQHIAALLQQRPKQIEFLRGKLNHLAAVEYPQDAALRARIKAYELAFRMQTSVPDALMLDSETQATHEMYGLNSPETRDFGMQMLAARRFVEKGVRFIQVQHGAGGAGAWDAHGGLKANHEKNFKAVDKPIAGLLKDLKQRGLLDSTIVIFASEFGRTPGTQGSDGRDHHIFGFSVWMAGGGIKAGVVHGATDEIGFHAVENRHYVTDIHATILHQLGLDSRKLEIPGRKRLDIDHGAPIMDILS